MRMRVADAGPRAVTAAIPSADVVWNWIQFGVHFAFRVALNTDWKPNDRAKPISENPGSAP